MSVSLSAKPRSCEHLADLVMTYHYAHFPTGVTRPCIYNNARYVTASPSAEFAIFPKPCCAPCCAFDASLPHCDPHNYPSEILDCFRDLDSAAAALFAQVRCRWRWFKLATDSLVIARMSNVIVNLWTTMHDVTSSIIRTTLEIAY